MRYLAHSGNNMSDETNFMTGPASFKHLERHSDFSQVCSQKISNYQTRKMPENSIKSVGVWVVPGIIPMKVAI